MTDDIDDDDPNCRAMNEAKRASHEAWQERERLLMQRAPGPLSHAEAAVVVRTLEAETVAIRAYTAASRARRGAPVLH